MNNLDLNNDWTKRETGTPSTYYGYTKQLNASDTDSVWAIRKVTFSGGVESILWNNNFQFSYSAKWSERAACFATPSGSLGVTYSLYNFRDSFSNTYSIINTSWTDLSGTNLYRVKVSDQNDVTYNYLYQPFSNNYMTTLITSETTGTSSIFRGITNMTYSITVTAVNALGTSASTVTVRT